MKLIKTNLIWGVIFIALFSCKTEDPKPPVIELPKIEDKVDPDKEKYGKVLTLGDQTYSVKSFRKENLTDNVDYIKLVVDESSDEEGVGFKLVAHTVRLDIKALKKGLGIEPILGGPYLINRATPLSMLKAESNQQQKVIAAVNGDFFVMEEGGTILGAMVRNGSVIKTSNNDWRLVYGITEDDHFFIDQLNYTITIGDDNYPINSVNGPRLADNLVIYTSSKGERTGANPYGSEVLLKPVNADWETLDNYEDVLCEVVSDRPMATAGGILVPKGHIALSAHGAGIAICNRYKKGDQVKIKINYPKGKSGETYKVKQAIGAAYPLLLQGEVQEVTSTAGNPKGKEPRTAIGHSKDFFYMVVVEGRSDASDGLTATQLASLLKHFDATDAVNLDGGGSSMLAIGNNLLGQPSGTTWFRPVPNALSIIRKN